MTFYNKELEDFRMSDDLITVFEKVVLHYDFNKLINDIEEKNIKVNILELEKKKHVINKNLKFNLYCELDFKEQIYSFIFTAHYNEKLKDLTIQVLARNFDTIFLFTGKEKELILVIRSIYDELLSLIKKDEQIRLINIFNRLNLCYDNDLDFLINMNI